MSWQRARTYLFWQTEKSTELMFCDRIVCSVTSSVDEGITTFLKNCTGTLVCQNVCFAKVVVSVEKRTFCWHCLVWQHSWYVTETYVLSDHHILMAMSQFLCKNDYKLWFGICLFIIFEQTTIFSSVQRIHSTHALCSRKGLESWGNESQVREVFTFIYFLFICGTQSTLPRGSFSHFY